GHPASAYQTLHPPNQWQGRTLYPNLPQRVGLRTGLSHLGTAHHGTALLDPPLQLAPPSLSATIRPTHQHASPRGEQTVEAQHLVERRARLEQAAVNDSEDAG